MASASDSPGGASASTVHEAPARRMLATYVPILGWLPTYSRGWLRGDVIAGITLVGLAVPESLGYAQIAGVPVQYGLYALLGGLIGYVVFGASRQLVVGPSAGLAAISAATVAGLAPDGPTRYLALTAALALIAGLVALVCGFLRLGFVAQFLSEPVLTGFIFGLALSIAMRQLPKLFGIEGGDGNFFQRLWHVLTHLGETNGWALAIGVVSLAILFTLKRLAPRVPEALVALAFGILAVSLLGLEGTGVAVVGTIPGGLPQLALPAVSLSDLGTLLPGALGLTLVAYAEHIGAASSFAARHHDQVNANQELIGLGVANLGAGICQGFIVGGTLSKTAANDAAGARSQVSGLTAAALTVVTMLLLTPLFKNLPEATLGAVIIVALWGLFRVDALRRYWRLRRTDFALALTALLGELLFDVLPGLLIAVVLSLLLLISRASRPNLSVLGRSPGRLDFEDMRWSSDVRPIPGVLLVRPNEGVFFANATTLRERVADLVRAHRTPPRAVVLDLEETGDLDIPGLDMLRELHDELRHEGVELLLVRVHHDVRDLLDRGGVTELIGADHIYPRALGAVRDRLAAAGDDGAEELRALVSDAIRELSDIAHENADYAGDAERRHLTDIGRALDGAAQAHAARTEGAT